MDYDVEKGMLPSSDWMSSQWRPAMGWMYMAVCIFDFIIFPVLWSVLQSVDAQGSVHIEWDPITLKGGGLFHVAMGAVLGISSWSRGQEKITAMSQGYDYKYAKPNADVNAPKFTDVPLRRVRPIQPTPPEL